MKSSTSTMRESGEIWARDCEALDVAIKELEADHENNR